MRIVDQAEVRERLTYDVCIPLVRRAMIALSRGETRQLLRTLIPLGGSHVFGIMPGALGENAAFGAKLISVFPDNFNKGIQSHQGVVVLFDGSTGAVSCVAHAGEVTAIRTAAASAVATDALARSNATRLAILGYGEQAETHARAILKVRKLEHIAVWGRSLDRAEVFACRMSSELGLPVFAMAGARDAVADADIVCTLTPALQPILLGSWVRPGTHVNVVGSGFAGPTEVDNDLVVGSRFIADYRAGVLVQGAEFLNAKVAGLVDDSHVVGEIGEVLDDKIPGRESEHQITLYKSLGHIVQDLVATEYLRITLK